MRRRRATRSIRSVGKYRGRRRRRWTVPVNEAVRSVVRKCALLRAAVPATARGIDSWPETETLLDDVRVSCRRRPIRSTRRVHRSFERFFQFFEERSSHLWIDPREHTLGGIRRAS